MKLTNKLIKKEKFAKKDNSLNLLSFINYSELREEKISFLPGTAPDIKL